MEDIKQYTFDEDAHSEGVSFKCPHCGSTLVFNAKTGGFSCETCGSDFSKEELDRKTISKETEFFDEEVKEYSCPSCGASIIADENTTTEYCAYCGSHIVLRGRVSGAIKPNLIIPFKISKDEAKDILKKQFKSYGFVPNSFFKEANLDKIAGIYYPFWETDVDTTSSILAECTKTNSWIAGDRKYTETKYFNAIRDGNIHLDDISVNALKDADKSLIEGVLPFPIDSHIPFDMSYMAGFYAKKNDLTYENILPEVDTKINGHCTNILSSTIHGYSSISVKKSDVDVLNRNKDYTLLPIWILSYNYHKKNYTFAINGVTGKIFGDLPLSKGKLWLTFGGITIAVASLLSLLGGLFL